MTTTTEKTVNNGVNVEALLGAREALTNMASVPLSSSASRCCHFRTHLELLSSSSA